MPTPSPTIVTMVIPTTDTGITRASRPSTTRATGTPSAPMPTGNRAAPSAPKARTRMAKVMGRWRSSPRRLSLAISSRSSRSSGVRPVTRTRYRPPSGRRASAVARHRTGTTSVSRRVLAGSKATSRAADRPSRLTRGTRIGPSAARGVVTPRTAGIRRRVAARLSSAAAGPGAVKGSGLSTVTAKTSPRGRASAPCTTVPAISASA
jgi:hypothetical protein